MNSAREQNAHIPAPASGLFPDILFLGDRLEEFRPDERGCDRAYSRNRDYQPAIALDPPDHADRPLERAVEHSDPAPFQELRIGDCQRNIFLPLDVHHHPEIVHLRVGNGRKSGAGGITVDGNPRIEIRLQTEKEPLRTAQKDNRAEKGPAGSHRDEGLDGIRFEKAEYVPAGIDNSDSVPMVILRCQIRSRFAVQKKRTKGCSARRCFRQLKRGG